MKCLLAYQWVKLRKSHLPSGKGILGSWLRLTSRSAFRKGQAHYCGYLTDVDAGAWVGGVVGLKSILCVNSRKSALSIMDQLSSMCYITYSLDQKTKVLSYRITDWVVQCTGDACIGEAVYATDGYGFICVPRNITERLIDHGYRFDEADAWLDLWCHTVWHQKSNAFPGLGPVVQFDYRQPVLTLDYLGKRLNWEKAKVWRFLQKHSNTFSLLKLPGSFGCRIYTSMYPTMLGNEAYTPTQENVMRILAAIRIKLRNTHYKGTYSQRLNQMAVAASSGISIGNLNDGLPTLAHPDNHCRIALGRPYYKRAYPKPVFKS